MNGGGKNSTRTFTVHKVHDYKNKKCCGRYKNNNPQNAAKKAFKMIIGNDKSKYISFTFEIRETTRGSSKKIYKYTFTRTIRENPIVIKRDGVDIVYKYKIHTKYIPEKQNKKTNNRHICSKEEKNNKDTGVCCSKMNTINKRSFESCKKHILRIKK